MDALARAYDLLFTGAELLLSLLLFACLIRCAMGPSVADRILAVNMSGTVTMALIAVLAVHLEEGYLSDVEVIYAMLSFLAVVLFTKVYMGAVREKRELGGASRKEETRP